MILQIPTKSQILEEPLPKYKISKESVKKEQIIDNLLSRLQVQAEEIGRLKAEIEAYKKNTSL